MREADDTIDHEEESASNLRAVFEILSYILVDAQHGNHKELAERIEFALNCAEKLIKRDSLDVNSTDNYTKSVENGGSFGVNENAETLI